MSEEKIQIIIEDGCQPPPYDTIINIPDRSQVPSPPVYSAPVVKGVSQTEGTLLSIEQWNYRLYMSDLIKDYLNWIKLRNSSIKILMLAILDDFNYTLRHDTKK